MASIVDRVRAWISPPTSKAAQTKAPGLTGDATVTSIVAGGAASARVADLEIYWSCIELRALAVASEGSWTKLPRSPSSTKS